MIVGVPTIALAGLYAVRRWLSHWQTSSEIVVAVGAMVTTLFALVLAFAAVNLYQGYSDAQRNVDEEANTLGQITRDVRALPVAERDRVDAALSRYIRVVVDVEFPAMRTGDAAHEHAGIPAADAVFTALQAYSPKTTAETAFYNAAVDRLNDLSRFRRDRIGAASSSLPRSFTALLLITALVSIAMTLFLATKNLALDIALISGLSIVIGAGLLTILLLEYPFSGSVSVTPDEFLTGTLKNLLAGHH